MWRLKHLNKIEYQKALDYQLYLVNLKKNGVQDDFILFMEHLNVFTMGKGANKKNILDENISIITTNRGGDLTYHGPGQLIGYLIMDLNSKSYDIQEYLRKIEELIIKTLLRINIKAYKAKGLTGVWAEGKKIASIGVGVKRGITMHGFALNINPDMANFYKIKPCGLTPNLISSIEELKNGQVSFKHIENLLVEVFPEVFGEILI